MLKQCTSVVTAVAFASSAFAGADLSNVIAQPSGLPATAAYGPVSGNDKPTAALNLLNDEAFGGTDVFNLNLHWTKVGSSDDPSGGPFTGNVESPTGTLTFDSPMTGPFAITLKAANFFSLYYFDASFAGTTSLDFNTADTASNRNGRAQDLSHATLFTAVGNPPPPPPPPTGVPSPTAALAGAALMGLLVSRRRRRK